MGILFSIGEILIDFIPRQKGIALKDVDSFTRMPGGAPAKFGGSASLITKVGEDAGKGAISSLPSKGEVLELIK